jgi:outer membrane protein assembly factor BamB
LRAKLLILVGVLAALALAGCGAAPTQVWPGLATNGELAFVAQGQHMFAVNLSSGQQVWKFPPDGYSGNAGLFVSDAGVGDGILVVGSEGPTGTYSGVLYGLDPATGGRQWCLAFDQKGVDREGCPLAQGGSQAGFLGLSPAVDHRIVGGVTVADGVAYVGLGSGAVYAVDAATGRDLWRFKAQRDVWAAPLVADGIVYVASLDHHVYALDRATGAPRWQQELSGALAGTPSLSSDGATLFVGTFGSELLALDAATGAERWSRETSNWVWSGPALDNGVLYFVDVAGTVYAVDAATGNDVWAPMKPGGAMRARPGLTAEVLYLGDRDGNLYALDRETGQTRQTRNLKGQLLAAPLVVGDLVLVAPFNGDNLVVAYTLALDETVRWAFAPSR